MDAISGTGENEKDGRRYRAVKVANAKGKPVLVVRRDTEHLDPGVQRALLEAKLREEGPFDELLVNPDTATLGFRSLDGLFKRLMEEADR